MLRAVRRSTEGNPSRASQVNRTWPERPVTRVRIAGEAQSEQGIRGGDAVSAGRPGELRFRQEVPGIEQNHSRENGPRFVVVLERD